MTRFIISVFFIGLLSSCLTSKKNEQGLFVYDYCLTREGNESILISSKNTLTNASNINVSGTVVDLKTSEPLQGVPVELTSKSQIRRVVTTDSIGGFFFKTTREPHTLNVRFIGYQDFTSDVGSGENLLIKIGLGESNAFVTYAIKSKNRLTKRQLKLRALELSEQE